MRLRTHAKVNLFLRIVGRREDGFHDVETILQSIALADELSVLVGAPPGVTMRPMDDNPFAPPATEDNLVWRALQLAPPQARGLQIDVAKRIPVGAGLGGGSANAAGALAALTAGFDLGWDEDARRELGAHLGSDVPFCIEGGTALASGRGETIRPLDLGTELWFVLGISHRPLATAEVYDAWDELGGHTGPHPAPMLRALEAGTPEAIGAAVHNDLQVAACALRPVLRDDIDTMQQAGALTAAVSGSGPTIFGLAEDEARAGELGARVQDVFDRVEVVPSAPACVEVVAGGGD